MFLKDDVILVIFKIKKSAGIDVCKNTCDTRSIFDHPRKRRIFFPQKKVTVLCLKRHDYAEFENKYSVKILHDFVILIKFLLLIKFFYDSYIKFYLFNQE